MEIDYFMYADGSAEVFMNKQLHDYDDWTDKE
jgi:hypothetical protein